jgi:hypothetical protein
LDIEVNHVWQPNSAQWRVILLVALLLIFKWPPDHGRSLGMKVVNRLVDPTNTLPALPAPLPIGLDDNGDAVAAHDAEEQEYYRQYSKGGITQLRIRLKEAGDPLEVTMERQILVGIGVLSALLVWRLNK